MENSIDQMMKVLQHVVMEHFVFKKVDPRHDKLREDHDKISSLVKGEFGTTLPVWFEYS